MWPGAISENCAMDPEPKNLLELENWSLVRQEAGRELTLLDRISLRIPGGRWLAVLGANGSGKSSLLKFLASEDSPLGSEAAIMFQDPDDQIIASTVARELTLGRTGLEIEPLLEKFGLCGLADLNPRLLSAGQKQRLVLAVALAGRPQVLLCDEPTALQDPTQAQWVLDQLRLWLAEPGHSLITATCDRREAAMADELLVLDEGRVVLQGAPEDVLDEPEVVALLGPAEGIDHQPSPWNQNEDDDRPTFLQVRNLTFRFYGPIPGFHLPELMIQPGQRVGIFGNNGSGKSTLLAACAGARKPSEGEIQLADRKLYQRDSLDLDHGLALLCPQFPEYLFTRETVSREIALDPALESWLAGDFLDEIGLDRELAQRNPYNLSSGQRRRLALGLAIFSGRPLLLLDEPTAALDRPGRERVLRLLKALPDETALIIASHDREFLAAAGCSELNLNNHRLDH